MRTQGAIAAWGGEARQRAAYIEPIGEGLTGASRAVQLGVSSFAKINDDTGFSLYKTGGLY
ncbi:MAG: hypothetical protein ACJ8F3_08670 [Xanthobacteraceae bacterium]